MTRITDWVLFVTELSVGRNLSEGEESMEVGDYIDCCGIREISGLSQHRGPAAALKSFCRGVYKTEYGTDASRFRYSIFSQIQARQYGDKFAAYILEHKLGDVIETTGRHVNPNSGNVLKVFVWTVDHDAVKLWWEKHGGSSVKKSKDVPQPAPPQADSRGPQAPSR
jgi:hypothetical protein